MEVGWSNVHQVNRRLVLLFAIRQVVLNLNCLNRRVVRTVEYVPTDELSGLTMEVESTKLGAAKLVHCTHGLSLTLVRKLVTIFESRL